MVLPLPPLFDDITDEALKEFSMEMAELASSVNALREKQLNGGGLTDDEVRQGIALIIQIRRLRAGGKGQVEVPGILQGKLEELF